MWKLLLQPVPFWMPFRQQSYACLLHCMHIGLCCDCGRRGTNVTYKGLLCQPHWNQGEVLSRATQLLLSVFVLSISFVQETFLVDCWLARGKKPLAPKCHQFLMDTCLHKHHDSGNSLKCNTFLLLLVSLKTAVSSFLPHTIAFFLAKESKLWLSSLTAHNTFQWLLFTHSAVSHPAECVNPEKQCREHYGRNVVFGFR